MIERCQLQAASCLCSKKIHGHRSFHLEACFKCSKASHTAKKLLCTLNYYQDPENNKNIQESVGHSPQIPAPQKNLSVLLGLTAKD